MSKTAGTEVPVRGRKMFKRSKTKLVRAKFFGGVAKRTSPDNGCSCRLVPFRKNYPRLNSNFLEQKQQSTPVN